MCTAMKFVTIISIGISGFLLGACSNDNPEPVEKVERIAAVQPKHDVVKTKPITASTAALTPEAAGKKMFKRCAACHTIDEGGRNRVGPNLWGMFGREAGSIGNFSYSKAMIASDIIWSDETLDAYITSPKTYIPKNKMAFIGLKKESDRKNVIAYLKANTSAP